MSLSDQRFWSNNYVLTYHPDYFLRGISSIDYKHSWYVLFDFQK